MTGRNQPLWLSTWLTVAGLNQRAVVGSGPRRFALWEKASLATAIPAALLFTH